MLLMVVLPNIETLGRSPIMHSDDLVGRKLRASCCCFPFKAYAAGVLQVGESGDGGEEADAETDAYTDGGCGLDGGVGRL